MKLEWDISELDEFGNRLANTAKFKEYCKRIVKQLAKELQDMLINQTPVKTGQLAAGWGGAENSAYKIEELKTCYKVTLYNRVPYANSVNDGHYSYNQYGGPYEVKHRTVPYTQGKNDPTFVFGHFFVEKSILLLENSSVLDMILYKELNKWFEWCING